MENVFARIERHQRAKDTALCLGLDPRPDWLAPYTDRENPWAAWGCDLIDRTVEYICAVKPNIAFYEAGGLDALEGLRKIIAYAHQRDLPVILDAKRGDIGSTAEAYAQAAFEWLGADAVTLNPYLGRDAAAPFLAYEGRGLFVLCHTSNPTAASIQTYPPGGRPLYEWIAEEATGWSDRVGLVVGATYPESVARVREIAPGSWLLLPGIGAQGGDLQATVHAARDQMIFPISRGIAAADDPTTAAQELCWAIKDARSSGMDLVPRHRHEQLILDLYRAGIVQFGTFTLASGLTSPIYIDLRMLVSYPTLLNRVAEAYFSLLAHLSFDRIAAVPYAALPIGTAVALRAGYPLIYPRKEVKAYGRKRAIEGEFQSGERIVLLDDLITTGGSKIEMVQVLREAGLTVEDVVVLIDRQGSGADDLAAHGLRLHAAFTLSEMLDVLERHTLLSSSECRRIRKELGLP